MMICRMSFFCASSNRRASLSPSAVLVWYGPTCAVASVASGISSAESIAQRLVAEEVDALFGEVELDVARRGLGDAPGPGHGLVAGRHLRRVFDVEIAFLNQTLHQLVEQLGELGLSFLVLAAAQRL